MNTTKKTKHTPGRWRKDKWGNILTRKGEQLLITGVALPCGVHSRIEEAKANNQLLFAAPDLLKAAQKVLDGLNARIDFAKDAEQPLPVFDGIADLHSAINKATRKVVSK